VAPPQGRAADSLAVRFEVGTASDVSNEQYYESSIDDTTFLGRRLHGAPETRVAGVAMAEFLAVSADGSRRLRFAPDVSWGNKAHHLGAVAALSGQPSGEVRGSLEARGEYRDDRSFATHRRDARASLLGRVRRSAGDGTGAWRGALGAELVRALEGSDALVLSGESVRAWVGYDHSPLLGWDWNVEYGATIRAHRDSADRDHSEHRLEASVREDFAGGGALSLAAGLHRRLALRATEDSRDRFLRGFADFEPAIPLHEAWSLRLALRAEATRYDSPDSVLDFDYQVVGASAAVRRDLGLFASVSCGPRVESLFAAWAPEEEYADLGLELEVERQGETGGWSVAPAIGRRAYRLEAASLSASASTAPSPTVLPHSSYDYAEVTGFLDQRLPGAIVVRALATARMERHGNPEDDARSLYFSFDVRRLF
jgi:hypothetical protein